jgi:DNA mismatch repair protein MSH2
MAESKKRKFFEVDETEDDSVKASNYDKDPGSFLRFYRSLATKSYDTVRIFERPDFYTVYDEDAELIAKEFFNTTKVIKQWGKPGASATPRKALKTNSMATPASNSTSSSASDGPQYLHINKGNQFETILKVLIHEKRCKVEIYACGDDRKWILKKKGSPGNMAELEDVLFAGNNEMQETNTLIAVKLAYEGGQRVSVINTLYTLAEH